MVTATISQWSNVINAWITFDDPASSQQHIIVPRTPAQRRSLISLCRKLGVTQFKIT